MVAECAALGVGEEPEGSSFLHLRVTQSNKKVSPVMEYFPVSPVAPPKRTDFVLETRVIVWPNLG